MTRSSYLLAQCFKAIGFPFTQRRLTNAAGELQLLRESEMILGYYVWEHTDNLDVVSTEYSTIRMMMEEREMLNKDITQLKDRVAKASHSDQKPKDLKKSNRQQLIAQHNNIAARADSIVAKNEQVTEEARKVRQEYNKLNDKIKEMKTKEEPAHRYKEEEDQLNDLKHQFEALKQSRQRNDQTLVVYTRKLEELEEQIHQVTDAQESDEVTEQYLSIGQANRKISNMQSQIGIIDYKLNELYASIGHKLTRQHAQDPLCRKAIKSKSKLVKIMKALRKSIDYNHRIAGR